ncbi:hypothetical protein C2L96_20670 [Bacillus cereus]|nr:hypothetical protein C2L96_20670 [Bacillus cereus]
MRSYVSNKKLPDLFRQFFYWIGCRKMSVSRYITKIADIFGVTIDILQKSLIYFLAPCIFLSNVVH